MAFDNASRLISALIRSESLTLCAERGVKASWFPEGSTDRMVYEFIVEHEAKYGSFPSAATVKDNFPSYRLIATTDPLDYFIDQLVAYNRRAAVLKASEDAAAKYVDGDHEGAISLLTSTLEGLSEFSVIPVVHTDLTKTINDRWEEYHARKKRGSSMIGYPSGYPTIDAATMGFQPEQLLVLVAPSKMGKSTIAMQVCINLHEEEDIRVLFLSFEMSRRELGQRHDAVRAKVPYSQFLNGTLTKSSENALEAMLNDLETRAPFFLADSSDGTTVSAVRAKIKEVDPDFVVIDGMYLMEDEITGEAGTPQALTNLTRGLKRLAQTQSLPIFITTQALRSKMQRGRTIGADSAGYSSSFSQDADVLLGLEEEEGNDAMRKLRVVMSRNCGPTDVLIDFNYDTGEFGEAY